MTLKQRLAQARALLAPGVYDALSALLAQQAGFEALYLSGASIAYTHLGRSDVGLTTYTEVADTLARITERVSTPVIVDADTGFGNALNVQRTVRGFERAGAAMLQLEDQTSPKRCGHLQGKAVVPTSEMCGKLRAALDARHSPETLVLARTDALAVEGLDAALDRAEAYRPVVWTPCSLKRCARPRRCRPPAPALRSVCRCWPTWWKVGKRPSAVPMNWRNTAFASSFFPAAPHARWPTRWPATTPACTATAPPHPGAGRCWTLMA